MYTHTHTMCYMIIHTMYYMLYTLIVIYIYIYMRARPELSSLP